jgi:hypothetical protein
VGRGSEATWGSSRNTCTRAHVLPCRCGCLADAHAQAVPRPPLFPSTPPPPHPTPTPPPHTVHTPRTPTVALLMQSRASPAFDLSSTCMSSDPASGWAGATGCGHGGGVGCRGGRWVRGSGRFSDGAASEPRPCLQAKGARARREWCCLPGPCPCPAPPPVPGAPARARRPRPCPAPPPVPGAHTRVRQQQQVGWEGRGIHERDLTGGWGGRVLDVDREAAPGPGPGARGMAICGFV